MSIQQVPTHILAKIFDLACTHLVPMRSNFYCLRDFISLYNTHRDLRPLLPKSCRQLVTFEHRSALSCNGHGYHESPWRTSANWLINHGFTDEVTHILVLMENGRCRCKPPILKLLNILRPEFFDWSSLHNLRFIGPGVFQRGVGVSDEDMAEQASFDSRMFSKLIPTITSMSYSLTQSMDLPLLLGFRSPLNLNPFYSMLYAAYEPRLVEVQEVSPVVPTRPPVILPQVVALELHEAYLRTIGALPRYSVRQLRKVKLLRITNGIPWDFFSLTGERSLVFENVEEVVFDFVPTRYTLPRQTPNGGLDIQFPSIKSVTVFHSCLLYDDVYELFHQHPPRLLYMAEDFQRLQSINPKIVAGATTLMIYAKAYGIEPVRLPRDIINRFFRNPSNVIEAVLTGNSIPFSDWIAWAMLIKLTIDLNPDDLHRLPVLIECLPLLRHLRVLYQTSTVARTGEYTWRPEDDEGTSAIGRDWRIQRLQTSSSRLQATAPSQPLLLVPRPPRPPRDLLTPEDAQDLPLLSRQLRRLDIGIPDDTVVDVLEDIIPQLRCLECITARRLQADAIRPFAEQHIVGVDVKWFERQPGDY
ncbi:hypothetical protein DL89DRAFT_269706 [Linderina pennispora]|uniref:F-box domain-containing protein n=1 Tax=Linderina pennispora TaxID=61395 RepID=A0A1Y1W1A7_9FUNG|nr:uncharacterized protein DL89DRAFT_269706 [Linderina pennispora]ORX67278.1 hypothetical protein DL89DRAFT_269706 [Linderina pennispora]